MTSATIFNYTTMAFTLDPCKPPLLSFVEGNPCHYVIPSMEFGRFQAKFCVVTVALRRKGSGHCLWSCRLLQVGFPWQAFPGHPVRVHGHRVSVWRTSCRSHNSWATMRASPWLVLEGQVSLKLWPMQHPSIHQIPSQVHYLLNNGTPLCKQSN